MPKRRTAKPPPRSAVNESVILAVDQATVSGWSIWVGGNLMRSGELTIKVTDPSNIIPVVQDAIELADAMHLPCTLITEHPWGGNPATLAGMGVAKALWCGVWDDCGGVKSRKVQVWPSHWRSRTLLGWWFNAEGKPRRFASTRSSRSCCREHSIRGRLQKWPQGRPGRTQANLRLRPV